MSKVAKIIFKNKNDEEFSDVEVLNIVQSLYCNGQILKEYIIEESKNTFEAIVTLTSPNALDKENWIKEVKEDADKMDMIIEIGDDEILFCNKMICDCDNPSFYIMKNYGHSSIKCGDCLKEVSLINIPELSIEERQEILCFANLYESIMNIGEYDEQYCCSQLENPDSKLNKLGVDICKRMEAKINKPVYYLQLTPKNVKTCPKCGSSLETIPIDINHYSEYCNTDKVCKKCNLAFLTNKKEK